MASSSVPNASRWTPLWEVNFCLIYMLNPKLAANMPAQWNPIPAEVASALLNSQTGRVRFSDFAWYFQSIATIVRNPTVQSSTDQMALSSTTITIRGSGFDPSYKNNVVTFNLGAVGYVTSATNDTLVVKFTSPPTVGRLKAVVTSFGGSSNAVQVATVRQATSTSSSYSLSGETDGGVYAQSFSYGAGVSNGYSVELISINEYIDLVNFKTINQDGTAAVWNGTTTSSSYSVTMTATTTDTIAYGSFTFDADLPGIINSYIVYDSAGTQIASGQKSD